MCNYTYNPIGLNTFFFSVNSYASNWYLNLLDIFKFRKINFKLDIISNLGESSFTNTSILLNRSLLFDPVYSLYEQLSLNTPSRQFRTLIKYSRSSDHTQKILNKRFYHRSFAYFIRMRFKWDILSSPKFTWTYRNKKKKIFIYSYAFNRKNIIPLSSTKILNITPQWRYRRTPFYSINSYIYSNAATPTRNIYIAANQLYGKNSFWENRLQAFLLKKRKDKLRPYRRIKRPFYSYRKELKTAPSLQPSRTILAVLPIPKKIKRSQTSTNTTFSNLANSTDATRLNNKLYLGYNASTLTCILDLFFDFRAFKWTLYHTTFKHSVQQFVGLQLFLLYSDLTTTYFYNRALQPLATNLTPIACFSHVVEKHFLKIITKIRYQIITTPWQTAHMNRFFTFCTGKRVMVRVNGFIKNSLTQTEQALCLKWSSKLQKFRKRLGNLIFLNESLQILYLSFKLKDPYFLSNWLTKMFQRVSFWKSRILLSYIRYVIRHFFFARFKELRMKGLKFQLSGKISVAGNSRTRTIRYRVGYTSQSKFDNRVLTVLNLIPSFTGIQGFKIWFFF